MSTILESLDHLDSHTLDPELESGERASVDQSPDPSAYTTTPPEVEPPACKYPLRNRGRCKTSADVRGELVTGGE